MKAEGMSRDTSISASSLLKVLQILPRNSSNDWLGTCLVNLEQLWHEMSWQSLTHIQVEKLATLGSGSDRTSYGIWMSYR